MRIHRRLGRRGWPRALVLAGLLAETRPANAATGGASFTVNAALTATGERMVLQGDVDWKNHVGHATVSAIGSDSRITEVYWADGVVLERIPTLDGPLAAAGHPVRWVARPFDPKTHQLDRLLALVGGLAGTQADNALLLQQAEGSAFLRRDELRGTSVDVLRYGTRNRYWVDPATKLTLRFEGDAETGGAPVVIDLNAQGNRTLALPANSDVVAADAVPNLYGPIR